MSRTLFDIGAGVQVVLIDGRVVTPIVRDPGGDVYVHGANGLEWLGGELRLRETTPVVRVDEEE